MLKIFATLFVLALWIPSAWAGPREDCYSSPNPETKIRDCTLLLEQGASSRERANQYNNRCIGYSDKGDYESSVADCTKAIEIDPQLAFTYNNRCLSYNKLGKYDLAIADCTKSLDLKNTGPQVPTKNRGDAYAGLGDYDRAIADYTRAIELLPAFDLARQALAEAIRLRDERVKGPLAKQGQVEIVPLVSHSQRVTSVAFSPDGILVLSGSDDGKLKLWQASTGRLIRTMRGHMRGTGGVASVVFSPDGKWALSGGSDRIVKLWDVGTGDFIRQLFGHTKSVTAVAFAPDGKRIVSASYDNTVVVSDALTFRPLLTFRGHVGSVTALAFSPDGTRILSGAGTNLYPRRADNSAKLWDATTGRVIQTFKHADEIASVSFSPEGTRVLTGSNDKTMKLWDASNGRLINSFGGYSYPVYSVSFSPDGADVLSGNLDGMKLYDATSGRLKRDFQDANGVSSARVSPEGRRVVTGTFQNTVELWDIATARRTYVAGNPDSQMAPTAVGFSVDDTHIVTGSRSDLRLWDIPNGVRVLTGDSTRMAISNDGKRILAGGDSTLKVIDAVTGQDIRTISGIPNAFEAVAFSPDGQRILAGLGYDRTTGAAESGKIKMWDASSGQLLMTFRGHGGGLNKPAFKGVGAVAFWPDGTRVVTGGGADGTHTNAPIGNGKLRFWDPATGQLLRNIDAHYYEVTSLAISADGSRIATGSDYDAIAQGTLITSIQTLRIWDAKTGVLLHSIGPNAAVKAVAFSPDGQQVLSGSDDNQLILWDSESGEIVRRFDGHSGSITAVTFSRNGARVLSASGDGTIRIWNRSTGEQLVTIMGGQPAANSGSGDSDWLIITPEGYFAASQRSAADSLSVVQGLDVYSIDQFYQALYRPDLVREKLAGDPRGLVREAAANVDLNKVIASGTAPELRTLSPANGTTTAEQQVSAEVEVSSRGGGIGRVEWRVNGLTIGVETPPASAAGQSVRLTRSLALDAGNNAIEVVAYNSANLIASEPARASVTSQAPGTPVASSGRLFVLAAGVNNYADARFKLALSVADVKALAQAFADTGKGQYSRVEVTTLVDAEVTADRLNAAFTDISAKMTTSDVFVLYLAGHGKTVEGRYHYVPQTFKIEGKITNAAINAAVKAQGIAQEKWQSWFAQIPARRSVILFDTCESGTLTVDESLTKTLEQSAASDRLAQATGRSILTASSGTTEAFEGYRGHGLFTYNLLDAFDRADSDNNGTIEVSELAAYVYAQVTAISEKVFKQRQEPQIKITSNYPLIKKARVLVNADDLLVSTAPTVQLQQEAQLQIKPASGATVVRSLTAKTNVTVLKSEGGWSLIASDGKPIGYVATRDLTPAQ